MATPRARGGMSLTIEPPIRMSPLVCFSSPQMMRRYVVLPQPEGPSSTMNSPSGTDRLMPFTAGTSSNFLTTSRVRTADIVQVSGAWRSGLAGPLLHDALAGLRGNLDRFLGRCLARRRPRHHVVDDERVVDLVHRRSGRSRIAGDGGPLVRVLQDRELVVRGRRR